MKIDDLSMAKLDLLYPDFKVRVIRVMNDMADHFSCDLKITESVRSFERQEALYAQGRTSPGNIVTNAKPGQSFHHYGVAVDVARIGKSPYSVPWKSLGEIAKGHGLRWGGDWNGNGKVDSNDFDNPHLEISYAGMNAFKMLSIYNIGRLRALWGEFDKARGVEIGREWGLPHNTNLTILSDDQREKKDA